MSNNACRSTSVHASACLIIGGTGFLSIIWDVIRWGHSSAQYSSKINILLVTGFIVGELVIAWYGTRFVYRHYLLAAMLLAIIYETYRMWTNNPLPHSYLSLILGMLWFVSGFIFSNIVEHRNPQPITE